MTGERRASALRYKKETDTMSTVYEVARWSEVFEGSDSRKYKSLPWIKERTDFDSTGWQAGLDEFGPVEWPRVYGNWMVIVRTVAKAKVRGRLSGDKGEAWTYGRIARPSGVDGDGIRVALEFAIKIGWLVPASDTSGESPDNLPMCREIAPATEGDLTEGDVILRNGTERQASESQPGRSVVFESPEAQETQITNRINEQTEDRPASITLVARSRTLPLLRELGNHPLSGTGVIMHGSVFADDRIKAHHIIEAPAAFFLKWYLDQLTATRPVFKNGNRGQACFVLAAVYAVRRCTDASLRGTKRIARWIHWVRTGETNQITDADFARAAKEVAAFYDAVPVIADAFKSAGVPQQKEAYQPPAAEVLAARAEKVADVKKRIQNRASK